MNEETDENLDKIRKKVAWSGFIFIAAFCTFLYLLGIGVHDDYLNWFVMAIILTVKPFLILVVAYTGANLINNFNKLMIILNNSTRDIRDK